MIVMLNNYRGITLWNVVGKLFSKILNNCLVESEREQDLESFQRESFRKYSV